MNDADRQTRSRLMRLFERQGRQPRHDLGQNFLVDLNLHALIVKHAGLSTADVVLEVGTGTGGLTARLADAAGRVVSVEFDDHVYGHARELLADRSNVTLIQGDALANKSTIAPEVLAAIETALVKVRATEAAAFPPPITGDAADETDNPWVLKPAATTLKLVANLPYNIATPLMSNLVASSLPWSRMVVTIQYELAERMLAKPGTGDYGALSVWLQSQCDLKLIRKLPPGVFWPPPKVDSAVLRIDRVAERQDQLPERGRFHELVRDIFTLRRKQILGVLVQLLNEPSRTGGLANAIWTRETLAAVLERVGVAPASRPEQLTVSQFVALSHALLSPPSDPAESTHG